MLPKKHRLPREEFRMGRYRRVSTPFFLLKIKNNTVDVNRIAVVVGTSVDKSAVKRNFWERQAKPALLQAPGKGKDFVLIIFPKVATLTKAQFIQEIKKVLKNELTII